MRRGRACHVNRQPATNIGLWFLLANEVGALPQMMQMRNTGKQLILIVSSSRPATLCAVNAVISILCGIYVSARLYASVVPEPTFAWRSQIVTLGDVRVARGLSLLLLGLLTFLPGITSVGVAGDVIPLAVASVVVLGASSIHLQTQSNDTNMSLNRTIWC